MKKRLPHLFDRSELSQLSDLLCLSSCFLIGLFAGCFFVYFLGQDAQEHLSIYLTDYITVLRSGGSFSPDFISTAWEFFRWPLFVLFTGLTVFGVVAIPLLFCLRGFLLAFTTATFVRLFGVRGLFAVLILLGICVFFTTPIFFVLGTDFFTAAKRSISFPGNVQKKSPCLQKPCILHLLCCGILLIVGMVLQIWSTPMLLHAAVKLTL